LPLLDWQIISVTNSLRVGLKTRVWKKSLEEMEVVWERVRDFRPTATGNATHTHLKSNHSQNYMSRGVLKLQDATPPPFQRKFKQYFGLNFPSLQLLTFDTSAS